MKIIPVVAGNHVRQRVISSACPAIDLLVETGVGKASKRCATGYSSLTAAQDERRVRSTEGARARKCCQYLSQHLPQITHRHRPPRLIPSDGASDQALQVRRDLAAILEITRDPGMRTTAPQTLARSRA